MGSPQRLVRTLTGLVVAMTSTAALLAWINPASSLAPSPVTLDELRDIARSAVHDGVGALTPAWRMVAVRCVPPRTDGLLAATAPSEDVHFQVDAEGLVTRTDRWRRQLPDRHAPHTIRIQVQAATDRAELSSAQAATVRALLETLEEHRIGDRSPLRIVDDTPRAQRDDPRQLLGQRI